MNNNTINFQMTDEEMKTLERLKAMTNRNFDEDIALYHLSVKLNNWEQYMPKKVHTNPSAAVEVSGELTEEEQLKFREKLIELFNNFSSPDYYSKSVNELKNKGFTFEWISFAFMANPIEFWNKDTNNKRLLFHKSFQEDITAKVNNEIFNRKQFKQKQINIENSLNKQLSSESKKINVKPQNKKKVLISFDALPELKDKSEEELKKLSEFLIHSYFEPNNRLEVRQWLIDNKETYSLLDRVSYLKRLHDKESGFTII